MDHLITWFEIPARDFPRAVRFYSAILKVELKQEEIHGTKMGFLPTDRKNVTGAIVSGKDYEPSASGVLVYLNGGSDLSVVLNRVEKAGGKILVPKTQISPEAGYFALFLDTEGNKVGLQSEK